MTEEAVHILGSRLAECARLLPTRQSKPFRSSTKATRDATPTLNMRIFLQRMCVAAGGTSSWAFAVGYAAANGSAGHFRAEELPPVVQVGRKIQPGEIQ
jgi:hypothetical protein